MLNETDQYFLKQEEPIKSCLMALRGIILAQDKHITEAWSYGMPFYYYKGKRFCYLWVHKKYQKPYLGIVDGKEINHPELLTENRSRMKILLIDPRRDIPLKTIHKIIKEVLALYEY